MSIATLEAAQVEEEVARLSGPIGVAGRGRNSPALRHDHGCMVRPYASQAARSLAPRPPVLAGAFAPVHAHPGLNEVHDRPQNREAEKAPGDGPDRKEPQPAGWTTTASRSSRGCCCCDSLVRPLGGLRVRRACLRPRPIPLKGTVTFAPLLPGPVRRGCEGVRGPGVRPQSVGPPQNAGVGGAGQAADPSPPEAVCPARSSHKLEAAAAQRSGSALKPAPMDDLGERAHCFGHLGNRPAGSQPDPPRGVGRVVLGSPCGPRPGRRE